MESFEQFNVSKQLQNAIKDLKFEVPTPIQVEAFPVILSGTDVVGISQTGTGKTFAYMLPLLQSLKFSNQVNPRILILVPTRELVVQVVQNIHKYAQYMSTRVLGVYGESNISIQKQHIAQGIDILVATPGRLYDLVVSRSLSLKAIGKLVIDEVDVMLDLGFRTQLTNIFDLLPERRQNIMFSATMTDEVEELITSFFTPPKKVAIAVSGTRLESITQSCYSAKNFYTKANLLIHLLSDRDVFYKVLVFVSSKKIADRLFDYLEENHGPSACIIHSNKSQNYRLRSLEAFETGANSILIATDVIARGLDLDSISHVINFDTPNYPENYMHRIGRTGRASQQGRSILFYSEKEMEDKLSIEALMDYQIPEEPFPDEVEIIDQLIPEERTRTLDSNHYRNAKKANLDDGFHEKKEKNTKVNEGGSYRKKLAKKHKKPQRRGDKIQNMKSKRK